MNHTFSQEHCEACWPGSSSETFSPEPGWKMECLFHCHLRNEVLSLEDFWLFLQHWSSKTFGPVCDRGPTGPLKHLKKEVDECLEVVGRMERLEGGNFDNKNELIEEFADLQFLIFDACWRAGFTYEDLRLAVNKKMTKNLSRQWSKPSSTEPVEHIRTEE